MNRIRFVTLALLLTPAVIGLDRGMAHELSAPATDPSTSNTIFSGNLDLSHLPIFKAMMLEAATGSRSCSPTSTPNSCYSRGSECKAIVLVCNDCCYNGRGELQEEKSGVCGVCIGWDF